MNSSEDAGRTDGKPPRYEPRRPVRGGGSTRDGDAHRAVLAAARELLLDRGYTKVTVEAIAERAGVPKSTIYRWWPNKASVMAEALPRPEVAVPVTPTFASDLRAFVHEVLSAYVSEESLAAAPGLTADLSRDPLEWERLSTEMVEPLSVSFTAILDAGRRNGAVSTHLDDEHLFQVVISTVLGYSFLWGRFPSHVGDRSEFAETVTTMLLNGLLSPAGLAAMGRES